MTHEFDISHRCVHCGESAEGIAEEVTCPARHQAARKPESEIPIVWIVQQWYVRAWYDVFARADREEAAKILQEERARGLKVRLIKDVREVEDV